MTPDMFGGAAPWVLSDLADLLRRKRIPLTTERATQDAIEGVLSAEGIAFAREASLDEHGRIDFLVGRVGIEVKIAHVSRPREIFRQLSRYCLSPSIDGLILATGRSVRLPPMTKPVAIVALGRAWL